MADASPSRPSAGALILEILVDDDSCHTPMIRGVQSDGAGAGVTGVQPVWDIPHTFALARLELPPPTLWSTSGLERLGLFDQFDELALDADALPPRRMGLPGQSQKDKSGGAVGCARNALDDAPWHKGHVTLHPHETK